MVGSSTPKFVGHYPCHTTRVTIFRSATNQGKRHAVTDEHVPAAERGGPGTPNVLGPQHMSMTYSNQILHRGHTWSHMEQ